MAVIFTDVRKQPVLPEVSVTCSHTSLYDYRLWSFDLLAPLPFLTPIRDGLLISDMKNMNFAFVGSVYVI